MRAQKSELEEATDTDTGARTDAAAGAKDVAGWTLELEDGVARVSGTAVVIPVIARAELLVRNDAVDVVGSPITAVVAAVRLAILLKASEVRMRCQTSEA